MVINVHLDKYSPLGINGLQYIKFPRQTRTLLLIFAPSESLALVNMLSYFDNPINLYVLLVGILNFCVHDLIH